MTANQINFQVHKETGRHNRAMEGIEQGKLNEAIRHNLVGEDETGRHNRVSEVEIERHNMMTEILNSQANAINNEHYVRMDAENERHNTSSERETQRHNVQGEHIDSEYKRGVVRNAFLNYGETNRHNQVQEGIDKSYKEGMYQVDRDRADSEIKSRDIHDRNDTINTIANIVKTGAEAYKDTAFGFNKFFTTGLEGGKAIAALIGGSQ